MRLLILEFHQWQHYAGRSCRGEAAQRATVSEVGSRAKTRVVSLSELSATYGVTGSAKFFEFLPHVRW